MTTGLKKLRNRPKKGWTARWSMAPLMPWGTIATTDGSTGRRDFGIDPPRRRWNQPPGPVRSEDERSGRDHGDGGAGAAPAQAAAARLGRGHVAVPGRGDLRAAGDRWAPGFVHHAGHLAVHRRRDRRRAGLRRAVAAPPLAGRARPGATGVLDLLGGGGRGRGGGDAPGRHPPAPADHDGRLRPEPAGGLVYVVIRPEPGI